MFVLESGTCAVIYIGYIGLLMVICEDNNDCLHLDIRL